MDDDGRQRRLRFNQEAIFNNPACGFFLLIGCLLALLGKHFGTQRRSRRIPLDQGDGQHPDSGHGSRDSDDPQPLLVHAPLIGCSNKQVLIPNNEQNRSIPLHILPTPVLFRATSDMTDNAEYPNLTPLASASALANRPRTLTQSSTSNSSKTGVQASPDNQLLARPTGRPGDDDSTNEAHPTRRPGDDDSTNERDDNTRNNFSMADGDGTADEGLNNPTQRSPSPLTTPTQTQCMVSNPANSPTRNSFETGGLRCENNQLPARPNGRPDDHDSTNQRGNYARNDSLMADGDGTDTRALMPGDNDSTNEARPTGRPGDDDSTNERDDNTRNNSSMADGDGTAGEGLDNPIQGSPSTLTTPTQTQCMVFNPPNSPTRNSFETGDSRCENNQLPARPNGRPGDDDSTNQRSNYARNNSLMEDGDGTDTEALMPLLEELIGIHEQTLKEAKEKRARDMETATTPEECTEVSNNYHAFIVHETEVFKHWEAKSPQCAHRVSETLAHLKLEVMNFKIAEHAISLTNKQSDYQKQSKAAKTQKKRAELRNEYLYFLKHNQQLLLNWQKEEECTATVATPLCNVEKELARLKRSGWDTHCFPASAGAIHYSKDVQPVPLSINSKSLYEPLHHGEVRLWKKKGNNCCLDAMNNAIAINNFISKSDVASVWSKTTPIVESFGLIDTILKHKQNTPYRLNKMDKANQTLGTAKIDSFHKLFQLRHGIYLVSLHVINKAGESVLHAVTFNASANFISDGAFRKVIDITEEDRNLSSDELEAKLETDFKYFQFVHVYQVRAHRTQIVRGNVPHHKATLPKARIPITSSSTDCSDEEKENNEELSPPTKKRSSVAFDGPYSGTRSCKRPKVSFAP